MHWPVGENRDTLAEPHRLSVAPTRTNATFPVHGKVGYRQLPCSVGDNGFRATTAIPPTALARDLFSLLALSRAKPLSARGGVWAKRHNVARLEATGAVSDLFLVGFKSHV